MVARRARTTQAKPVRVSITSARARGRAGAAPSAPAAPPMKVKAGDAAPTQAAPNGPLRHGKQAPAPAPVAVATRVPPPSKGELRAHIETLETANATLKAKERAATRAARLAARRIAELEGQVAQFQEAAAKAVDPAVPTEKLDAANAELKAKARQASRVANLAQRRITELEEQVAGLQAEAAKVVASAEPEAEVKTSRRGRPPGRRKAIDPGDAVPPGVAVEDSQSMDAEAEAARDALEANLSGAPDPEGE